MGEGGSRLVLYIKFYSSLIIYIYIINIRDTPLIIKKS
jgi:hypothetical protein